MTTAETDGRSTTGRRSVHFALRAGLAAALALMVAGVAVKLATGDHRDTTVALFDLGHTAGLGDALMGAGIAVLAATPAVRVLLLIGSWARERDWRFVAVGLAVITTLAIALLVGGA